MTRDPKHTAILLRLLDEDIRRQEQHLADLRMTRQALLDEYGPPLRELVRGPELRTLRDIVTTSLRESETPMSAPEIANLHGKTTRSIAATLGKMFDAGEIVRAERGRYRLKSQQPAPMEA